MYPLENAYPKSMELDTGNPELKLHVQDIQLFFQVFIEPRSAML